MGVGIPSVTGFGDDYSGFGGIVYHALHGAAADDVKEVRKVNMREIPTIIPEDEFQEYLEEIEEMVGMWKDDGLGYVSVKCQLADFICTLNTGMVFTVGQIRRIFELAR